VSVGRRIARRIATAVGRGARTRTGEIERQHFSLARGEFGERLVAAAVHEPGEIVG
jgi:hypothetical protein